MDAVAKSWIKHAKNGSASHLAMILERLYPVEKDAAAGRTLLEGIRLELAPDGQASVTLLRGSGSGVGGELRDQEMTGLLARGSSREEDPAQGTPDTPREVILESPMTPIGVSPHPAPESPGGSGVSS